MWLAIRTPHLLFRLVGLLSIVLLLWGCDGDNSSKDNESSKRSAAITFQLKFVQTSNQVTQAFDKRGIAEPDICADYLIEDLIVTVYRTLDGAEIASMERSCAAHGLTINNIPAKTNLYVVCKGYLGYQNHWQGRLDDIIVEAGQTKNLGIIEMSYVGNDASPPEIASIFPAQNASDVDLRTSIAVVFNEPLAPSSIDGQTITVLNNNAPVPGMVSYDANTYTISFTPTVANGLDIDTDYTATLTARNDDNITITDTAGQAFNDDVTWQFTTRRDAEDNIAPQIIATSPANGAAKVSPQISIQAVFSEPMDSDSFNASVFQVSSAQSAVSGQIVYDDQTRTLSLIPDSPLNAITLYTASISNEARDIAGIPLSETYTWQFGILAFELEVTKAGSGSGTVTSAAGIDCGDTCRFRLGAGATVTLTAMADDVSEFTGWSGEHCDGSIEPCSFALEKDTTITANFALRPTYTISTSVVPEGGLGGFINPVSATVIRGHNQTFQFHANTWYHLSELIVDGNSVGAPSTYMFEDVTENHSIQAVFEKSVKNISKNPSGNDSSPQINSKGHVVWSGIGVSGQEIYYYNGSTVDKIPGSSAGDNTNPQINSNGHVVWSGFDDSGSEIYYYDGSKVINISNNISTNSYDPQINSKGHVVWSGVNGTSWGVYYYDGSKAFKISKDIDQGATTPQINVKGDVVWSGFDGSDSDIYYYNYNESTMVNISNNPANGDHFPKINAKGDVVWHGSDGSDSDIYYYNHNDSTVVNISDDPAIIHYLPQINDNGDVVWHSSDKEIYYYNHNDLTVVNISNNTTDYTKDSQINKNGHVVWKGHTDSDYGIYYYNGLSVRKISKANLQSRPKINSDGQVVWVADKDDNDSDWEIYLATP